MSQNTFDRFTVLFTKEKVFLGEKPFPLGQLTTDLLNLDERVLDEIEERINIFLPTVQTLLREKTDNAAHMAQENLNPVWNLIFELPVYRDIKMDIKTSYNLFPILLSDQDKWNKVLEVGSEGNQMFEKFVSSLKNFTESLRSFRRQIEGMLKFYFEPLARHNQETYAEAFAEYFSSMRSAGELFFPDEEFEQSYPARICFVPIANPAEQRKPLLAEKTEFRYLIHFLYTEFYRGLTAGNMPRKCHNCGRYFLLTEGYNTCYCNNIAPGETERTCRKVGAHRKANHPTGLSPAQMEYRKVYNRLKARKQRGKISSDEWNNAVAQAQEVLMQAEQGKLSDEEMRKKFISF